MECRLIYVANRRTGAMTVMSGVGLRHAVLQAHAVYDLADVDTVDLEAAYGDLIEHSDEETATGAGWIATYREEDLVGIRRRTLEEALKSGGQLTTGERAAIDGMTMAKVRTVFPPGRSVQRG